MSFLTVFGCKVVAISMTARVALDKSAELPFAKTYFTRENVSVGDPAPEETILVTEKTAVYFEGHGVRVPRVGRKRGPREGSLRYLTACDFTVMSRHKTLGEARTFVSEWQGPSQVQIFRIPYPLPFAVEIGAPLPTTALPVIRYAVIKDPK